MDLNQQETRYVLNADGRDHHAQDAALRARGPACPVDVLGVEAWSISDPSLIRKAFTDARFSKNPRNWAKDVDEVGNWPLKLWVKADNMLTADGEKARRLRRVAAAALAPRRVASLLPVITRLTQELLEGLAALPPGEPIDLNKHFAEPLPMQVLAEVLGIPKHLRERFLRGANLMCDTTKPAQELSEGLADFRAARLELIAIKRAEPADDLTSRILAIHEDDPDGLSEKQLLHTLGALMQAGFETTVNLLHHAVVALATHPRQLAMVQAGHIGWDQIIEEALRYESPIKHMPMRFATEDIPIDACMPITKGDAILTSLAAANRHPDYHGKDADEFDITRATKDHLAFGHGPHYCPGAQLARAEAIIALRALFERFPNLQLAVEVDSLQPKTSLIFNGYIALPVYLRG